MKFRGRYVWDGIGDLTSVLEAGIRSNATLSWKLESHCGLMVVRVVRGIRYKDGSSSCQRLNYEETEVGGF
jgi:hypothetical protein